MNYQVSVNNDSNCEGFIRNAGTLYFSSIETRRIVPAATEEEFSLPAPPQRPNAARMVTRLPEDIQQKIYEENFGIKAQYADIMKILGCMECQILDQRKLIPCVMTLFLDKNLREYMLRQALEDNSQFDVVWNNHQRGEVYFRAIRCEYSRFALAWLYFKYH
jgi:hypothetical protein